MVISSPVALVVRTKTGWAIYERGPHNKPGRLLSRAANLRDVQTFLTIYQQTLEQEDL